MMTIVDQIIPICLAVILLKDKLPVLLHETLRLTSVSGAYLSPSSVAYTAKTFHS